MQKIAASLKKRGAMLGDPKAATSNPDASRKRSAPNDVGWRIWRGNYGNGLITQVAPDATSVGWYHVGPQDQRYGRFARGFEHASLRTQMHFILDKRLWGGLPRTSSSATLSLHMRVVYFNEGAGSFQIAYDALGGNGCKMLKEVTVTNTGRWVELDFTITDAAFGEGCAASNTNGEASPHVQGGDIVLRSMAGDTIIHGVEIYDPTKIRP
jgi:hypothetical protein